MHPRDPGARRSETARSAARAAGLALDDAARERLRLAFGTPGTDRHVVPSATGEEVVLVMGIPGAGKTRVAQEHVDRGYLRLNRDERGGSLAKLAEQLDAELAAGARRIVLDNTYLTRAARSYVVQTASRHGVPARCVWLDTPLAQAQVNLVERLLDRFGALPGPQELRALARREPGALAPTSQMRTVRELEAPSADEGFASVEVIPFARAQTLRGVGAGVFVAAPALRHAGWRGAVEAGDPAAAHLIFDWRPGSTVEALEADAASVASAVAGPVASAVCPHPGGPPQCWCRPPLPGLPLAFARAHGVDLARSLVIGCRPAHRTLATTLGTRYISVA